MVKGDMSFEDMLEELQIGEQPLRWLIRRRNRELKEENLY